ncbi:hypothetical protein [Cohnella endophytica]|nr:hypothetical protein [Cohnella endophytica]
MSKVGIALGGGEALGLPTIVVGFILGLALIGLNTIYKSSK